MNIGTYTHARLRLAQVAVQSALELAAGDGDETTILSLTLAHTLAAESFLKEASYSLRHAVEAKIGGGE